MENLAMMIENGYWTALEQLQHAIGDVKAIIVDTRDFCFNLLKPSKFANQSYVTHLLEQQPELYLFTDEEVVQILTDMKQATGGNVEWRQFVLRNLPKLCISIANWFKYAAFQRDEVTGKWFCYVTYGKVCAQLLQKKHLSVDNIEIPNKQQ